jgi:hypothetical protein
MNTEFISHSQSIDDYWRLRLFYKLPDLQRFSYFPNESFVKKRITKAASIMTSILQARLAQSKFSAACV